MYANFPQSRNKSRNKTPNHVIKPLQNNSIVQSVVQCIHTRLDFLSAENIFLPRTKSFLAYGQIIAFLDVKEYVRC